MSSVVSRHLSAVLATLCIGPMLWYFHNRFWWPVDEGVYAYVAQQLLSGARLHGDLIDIHAGYVNYLHAGAMKLFGEDLLSMRYPLVLATALQSLIVFRMLMGRGSLVAFAGSFSAAAFGAPMFLNPSANWYALAIYFATAFLLRKADPRQARDVALAGFLVGLCFFVRQLSGVFLAMAVLTWLLVRCDEDRGSSRWATIGLSCLMIAGLVAYLFLKGDMFGGILFGTGPLLLIIVAGLRGGPSPALASRWMLWGGGGFLLAGLPLAVVNIANATLFGWLHDMLFTALIINNQSFIPEAQFSTLIIIALHGLSYANGGLAFASALTWLMLFLLVPTCGFLALRDIRQHGAHSGILTVMAPFWAVSALHYQIPVYFFFVVAPLLAAVLSAVPGRASAVAALGLSCWFLLFQAAQPMSRTIVDIVMGRRDSDLVPAGLPRVSLLIPASDKQVFGELVARIESAARPGEKLMSLPMDPEVNFITRRQSPVNYYGTPLGLRTDADVDSSFRSLESAAPIFVVHRRVDKYLTPLSKALLARIIAASPAPEPIGEFDLYRLPAPAQSTGDSAP